MTILHCDRALHAMNEKQTSIKQVFPRPWQRCQDEELAEVVLSVVGRAPRYGLDLYASLNGRCDPDQQ